jgi:hypothetical protein
MSIVNRHAARQALSRGAISFSFVAILKLSPAGHRPGFQDMMPWLFRFAALIAAGLWLSALFSRFQLHFLISRYPGGPSWEPEAGWWLLAAGWLFGPFGLSIAWYANIPFAVCIFRMARGLYPGMQVAIVGFVLALTGLLPFFFLDIDIRGYTPVIVRGSTVWLWLSAFLVVF